MEISIREFVRVILGMSAFFAMLAPCEAAGSKAPETSDSYLCYKGGLQTGQPKLASGLTADLRDTLSISQTYNVGKVGGVCNPAAVDGGSIAYAAVHEESFAIKRQTGAPKFVASDHITVDAFGQRTLTLIAPSSLLDVTPTAAGSTPPTSFASDPTSATGVNRFKCYKAKLAKGSSPFVAPTTPTVVDEFFPAGQSVVMKKVSKVCLPADVNGETPGAQKRTSNALVCYQVKLPKGAAMVAHTVASNGSNFGAQVLDTTRVAELCVSATFDPLTNGQPIVAPYEQWTWTDFPDSACDDGSPTGIGINPTNRSTNVLVFLDGGGACWDYTTCYVLNKATHGPFGQSQFSSVIGSIPAGSIFDRTSASNPFRDWSFVFVPYCTGDLHGGNNVATYQNATTKKTYHHVGHSNILAYLQRLAPTFPTIGKMVVSGSSAGGYGASFNYATFRSRWPDAEMYLVDDSGPPLEGSAIPVAFSTAFWANWHLGDVLLPICGTACQTDLSQLLPALAGSYPEDRMALLSSLQDATISSYLQLSAADFQTDLLAMATDRIDPLPKFRYFIVSGSTHGMLGVCCQNGTGLVSWLTQEVSDDPGWVSIKP